MSSDAKIMVGTLGLRDAEHLRARMSREGIEILTVHNRATCTSGCSTTVEVWVHPADLSDIQRLMAEARQKELEGLGADPQLIDQVYDPDQATAVCPACGTEFETSSDACPDCGLGFALPPGATAKRGCGSGGCA
jgi:hypothetical protein